MNIICNRWFQKPIEKFEINNTIPNKDCVNPNMSDRLFGGVMLRRIEFPATVTPVCLIALKTNAGIKTIEAAIGERKALLWEVLQKEDMLNPDILARAIKNLPITINSTRPITEAISSAGGIRFEVVDENLMLKSLSGTFCAGEMLDWEAPTGGYLLTACFSTGYAAGHSVKNWLLNRN